MMLIDCPYQNCEVMFAAVANPATCVCCGREVWKCPTCGSINRVFAIYCRSCRRVHEIRPIWPQEGYDDRRSHLPTAWPDRPMACSWLRHLPNPLEDGEQQFVYSGQMGPAPVIVGDAVFYFDIRSRTLNSHFLFKQDALLWSVPVFSNVPFASSLVHYGPYLYFVTPHPNKLQRVVLDSGAREICSVVTQDGAQIDLPDDIIVNSPPTLLANPSRIPGNQNRWLVILRTRGILFIDLASASRNEIPSLNAKWVGYDFLGREWGKPVVSGRYLVAVAQNAPDVLVVDLAALPEIVYVRILTPHGYGTASFSPCLVGQPDGLEDSPIFWLTKTNDNGSSALTRFQPPSTFNWFQLDAAPNLWTQDWSKSQPLIDVNRNIYAPGDGEFTILSNQGGLILKVNLPINSPIDFSHSMFVRQVGDMLVCAEQQGTQLINPFGAVSNWRPICSYSPGRFFQPVARPILGHDRLFIQCAEIVACFSLV